MMKMSQDFSSYQLTDKYFVLYFYFNYKERSLTSISENSHYNMYLNLISYKIELSSFCPLKTIALVAFLKEKLEL